MARLLHEVKGLFEPMRERDSSMDGTSATTGTTGVAQEGPLAGLSVEQAEAAKKSMIAVLELAEWVLFEAPGSFLLPQETPEQAQRSEAKIRTERLEAFRLDPSGVGSVRLVNQTESDKSPCYFLCLHS